MIIGTESRLKILRSAFQPAQERPPDRLRLQLVEPLEHHCDIENVARPEADLLAPMRIEQRRAVEFQDLADQPAEGGVRCRLDRREHRTEELWQFVCAQRKPRYHAEAAATAALDFPE
ncbi:hypothetical protein NKH23_30995 [Mesorhizobium sp. M1328]|uniref:hypothetical protein n=1 Tax=Mesorhizobium sp. M1328 TaxID=2957082 RepID=UPI0033381E94